MFNLNNTYLIAFVLIVIGVGIVLFVLYKSGRSQSLSGSSHKLTSSKSGGDGTVTNEQSADAPTPAIPKIIPNAQGVTPTPTPAAAAATQGGNADFRISEYFTEAIGDTYEEDDDGRARNSVEDDYTTDFRIEGPSTLTMRRIDTNLAWNKPDLKLKFYIQPNIGLDLTINTNKLTLSRDSAELFLNSEHINDVGFNIRKQASKRIVLYLYRRNGTIYFRRGREGTKPHLLEEHRFMHVAYDSVILKCRIVGGNSKHSNKVDVDISENL